MISALVKKPDGTLELTITIPQKRILSAYKKALDHFAEQTEIKGFRKGKAPRKKVEEKIGKSKIYEEVLKILIPQAYTEAIKEQNIKPIINPQINIISLQENKDWQIKAITCELPEIILGDYKNEIRKALASEKIWTPGKDKKTKFENNESEILRKIFQTLLETTKIQIPEILIQEEVNRMLSRLIDQTNSLGITIDQYLNSVGKTNVQLQQEYRQQAEETIKLELILDAIANKEKIETDDNEIDEIIISTPDEKVRKKMNTPFQKAYLRHLLRKRKVIDILRKL